MIRITPSVISLALANMVPLVGVIFLGWQVFPLMVLFWIENIVIGILNIPKIILAQGSTGKMRKLHKRVFLAFFFCFHYGFFSYIHGMFVFSMFGESSGYGDDFMPRQIIRVVLEFQLYWAIVALLASHVFSLVSRYILAREYQVVKPKQMMRQPYSRVVILHIVILAGGFLLQTLHEPVFGLVVLIVVKTVIDAQAHVKEHGSLAKAGEKPDIGFAKAD